MDTIRKLDLKYQIGPKPIDENDKKSASSIDKVI